MPNTNGMRVGFVGTGWAEQRPIPAGRINPTGNLLRQPGECPPRRSSRQYPKCMMTGKR